MARLRLVTHVYRLPEGWVKARRGHLTDALAEQLRAEGYTMVRARRGLFDIKEKSLRWHGPAQDTRSEM